MVEKPLAEVAVAEGQVVFGAVLEMVLAVSVVGIAVLLFPVLKKRNEGMALGYVGMRIFEDVLILAATTSALVVLTLGQDHGQAANVGLLVDLLLAFRDWTYLVGTLVMFSLSALILNILLYQSSLVPTWLSVWGLVGGVLLLVRALLEMFGRELSGVVQGVLAGPIGLNEMVLAVWLIVRGFNADVLESRPEKAPVSG